MSREIDSIHDLDEHDVMVTQEFALLCEALAAYGEDREPYEYQQFDVGALRDLASAADELYGQVAVIVAQASERQVDPDELIADVYGDDRE